MTDEKKEAEMGEEIIELTDVVEEEAGLGPRGEQNTASTAPDQTYSGRSGEPAAESGRERERCKSQRGAETSGPARRDADFLLELEPETSPPASGNVRLSPAVPSSSELEMERLKEAWKEKAEAWIASEGAQIMERVAREVFPRIAQEVLEKEIEKMKAEGGDRE